MRTLPALALITFAGCGGGDSATPSAGTGGAAGAAGAASGGAAGASSGGSGGAAPVCAQQEVIPTAGPPKQGRLAVVIAPASTGAITTNVAGAFADGGYGLEPAACAVSKTSSCEVRRCKGPSASDPPKLESVGTITLTGAAFPVTLKPTHSSIDPAMAASDLVYGTAIGAQLFVGGETITVAAAGALVPAFTTSVHAPPPIDLTEPLDGATLDPGGVSLSWPAGDGDTFVVLELGSTCAGVTTHVTCTYVAKDGKGFIPADALAGLHGTLDAKLSTQGISSLQASDFQIEIELRNDTGVGPTTLVLP